MLKIMKRPGSVDKLKSLLYEMGKEFSYKNLLWLLGTPGENGEALRNLGKV